MGDRYSCHTSLQGIAALSFRFLMILLKASANPRNRRRHWKGQPCTMICHARCEIAPGRWGASPSNPPMLRNSVETGTSSGAVDYGIGRDVAAGKPSTTNENGPSSRVKVYAPFESDT